MTSSLERFLTKNSIPTSEYLPLVHTTAAYHLARILKGGSIEPAPCDVFAGEDLSYFFYGRPSYKMTSDQRAAKYWELPSVIILDYSSVDIKRTFPFDTGAFEGKRYPHFMNMMPMEEFDASSTLDAAPKLVGTFFVDSSRYFRLKPRAKSDFLSRFQVDVLEEEIRALYDLVVEYDERIDDRRFSIEIQSSKSLELKDAKVLGVVFPEEYLESAPFVELAERLGAELLPYPSYPLKQEAYYHTIYNIIFEFYRELKLVK